MSIANCAFITYAVLYSLFADSVVYYFQFDNR